MKRLRILVDADSTVADLLPAWLAAYNEAYNDTLAIDQIKTFEIHDFAKAGHKIYNILNEPGFFNSLPEMPGAADALKQFKADGHEVLIVTATSCAEAAKDKFTWLQEHLGFTKKEIILAHRKEIIRGDVFIDDSPHQITAYRAANPYAFVCGIEHPYNAHLPCMAPSWKEPAEAWTTIVEWVGRRANQRDRRVA